jgi:hypothetical protein
MANPLDEKFLDGPNVGYCSDSDDDEASKNFTVGNEDLPPPGNGGPQTGPKGVMNDYKMFEEECRHGQKERNRIIAEHAKRMCVAPTPHNLSDDEDDELAKLRRERYEKMRQLRFGRIEELTDKYQFLNVIDNGIEDELIIIHIYREDLEACTLLHDALLMLSGETKDAKYYRVKAICLNTSDNFERNALPTLQIYLKGEIIANFVRITDELPEEFDNKDVYNLIQKRNVELKLKTE